MVQLGSNPWVNGFIALVFFAFGLSLLGAFEITIPSSVLTRLNAASGNGRIRRHAADGADVRAGFVRLRGAVHGHAAGGLGERRQAAAGAGHGVVRRAVWRCRFSFWRCSRSICRSCRARGGWLARVKVVMGFLILAAMLKYLSSLDQVLQLGFLTRERFLAAAGRAVRDGGLYLLGFVRLRGHSSRRPNWAWRGC